MSLLQRIGAMIDRLNDRIGDVIQWLALIMVLVGAFNALARYATRYTGLSLVGGRSRTKSSAAAD